MNCAQHNDIPAVAYCRTCGKALCETCKRDVQGTIFCDPCLAARVHGPAGGNFGSGAGSYQAGAYQPPQARAPEDASPGLALFLGFIPGVGAFYNGQFVKGFVHVFVMSTLIWMSDHGMGGFAGLLIAAWVFYMVFDAWSTAKARRYGLPIPDPLGLNHILEGREGTFRQRVEQAGERLGTHVEYAAQNISQQWQKAGAAPPAGSTAANATPVDTTAAQASQPGPNPGVVPPPPGPGVPPPGPQGTYYAGPEGTAYVGPQGTYFASPDVTAYVPPKEREHSPVGAVVLIGLGLVFLLANLDWFSFHWVSHFWPLILVGFGVWLFVRRRRDAR
jgi:TM2 domain-containing membrane protein YozV